MQAASHFHLRWIVRWVVQAVKQAKESGKGPESSFSLTSRQVSAEFEIDPRSRSQSENWREWKVWKVWKAVFSSIFELHCKLCSGRRPQAIWEIDKFVPTFLSASRCLTVTSTSNGKSWLDKFVWDERQDMKSCLLFVVEGKTALSLDMTWAYTDT